MQSHATRLGTPAALLAALLVPMSAVADSVPDPFGFNTVFNVHRDAFAYSTGIVTGIDEPSPVRLRAEDPWPLTEGSGYSIGCTANYTDQPGTLLNGQLLCVRHRGGYKAGYTTLDAGGWTSANSFRTFPLPDRVPEPAGFALAYNVIPGAWAVASPVTVNDVCDAYEPCEVPMTTSGLEYQLDCAGNWTRAAAHINDFQAVCARVMADGAPDTLKYGTLRVGDAKWTFGTFTGTALTGVPTPFAFEPSIGVRRGFHARASTVVTGLAMPAAVTATGGFWASPLQTETDVPGFLLDNDALTLSHVAPRQFGATTTTTANVGGVTAVFTSRTIDRRVLTSGRLQDTNGDGYADMLWRNGASGDAKLWLLDDYYPNTHGIQWEFGLLGGRVDWAMTHVGDLDGDGTSDLVWRNEGTGETALWLMSEGMYLRGAVVVNDPAWKVTHVGDFDGDGTSDLLWHNATDGRTILWLVDGIAFHAWAVLLQHADWKVQHTGDFDGDGKADLLWRNRATGETAMWLMDGMKIRAGAIVQANGAWIVEQVGDLDGDGHDDLVWSGPNQEVALYLMDGTARRAGARLPAGTGTPVAIADFDADGKADLLIRTTQGIERYRMDGLTVLGTALELDLAKTLLRATDFNGDGRADVAYDDPAAVPPGIQLRYTQSLSPVTGPNPQPVSSDPAWKLQ